MRRAKALLVLAVLAVLIGCKNPVTHIRANPPEVRNHISNAPVTVNSDVESTWNRLLSQIMVSKFKIQKIDSASHIISLKLYGEARDYVDCGSRIIESEGKSTRIINIDTNYSYLVHRSIHDDTYRVENQFKGKAIIFVSGNQLTSTIQMKTNYEIISTQNISTTQGARNAKSDRFVLNLSGNERKQFDVFGTYCQSTGKLEDEVRALF